MTNFTPEQLIAYYYGELPPTEAQELESALRQNWTLREKYQVIKDAARQLDKGMRSPGWHSVQSVLNHAQPTKRFELMEN